jgi:hypothetical protein
LIPVQAAKPPTGPRADDERAGPGVQSNGLADSILPVLPARRDPTAGTGIPEDLPLLDRAISQQADDAEMMLSAPEVGVYLGTVIINSVAGARWRVRPNGHPVIVTAFGRELDVVAMTNRLLSTGGPSLASIYADVASG